MYSSPALLALLLKKLPSPLTFMMHTQKKSQPAEILLVDDNSGDRRLTIEAFKEGDVAVNLSVVQDGEEAIAFLQRKGKYANALRPDLILLDLNLPKKDGREVLAEVKQDAELKLIPIIVLTTSQAQQDVLKSYELHANCYITKPMDLDQFITVVKSIETFWLTTVQLPPK